MKGSHFSAVQHNGDVPCAFPVSGTCPGGVVYGNGDSGNGPCAEVAAEVHRCRLGVGGIHGGAAAQLYGWPGRPRVQEAAREPSKTVSGGPRQCYTCGKPGHLAKDCSLEEAVMPFSQFTESRGRPKLTKNQKQGNRRQREEDIARERRKREEEVAAERRQREEEVAAERRERKEDIARERRQREEETERRLR